MQSRSRELLGIVAVVVVALVVIGFVVILVEDSAGPVTMIVSFVGLSVISMQAAIKAGQSAEASIESKNLAAQNTGAMVDLKEHTNSKLDRLLKTVGQAEFAKGKLAGQEEEAAKNQEKPGSDPPLPG